MVHLVDGVAWCSLALAVVQHDGHSAKVAHQVEVGEAAQESGFVDIVLFALLVEERGAAHLLDHYVGAVDGSVVLFPRVVHKEVGGLYGKVRQLANVG